MITIPEKINDNEKALEILVSQLDKLNQDDFLKMIEALRQDGSIFIGTTETRYSPKQRFDMVEQVYTEKERYLVSNLIILDQIPSNGIDIYVVPHIAAMRRDRMLDMAPEMGEFRIRNLLQKAKVCDRRNIFRLYELDFEDFRLNAEGNTYTGTGNISGSIPLGQDIPIKNLTEDLKIKKLEARWTGQEEQVVYRVD